MPVSPCANYRNYRAELEAIDEILQRSGLDAFIIEQALIRHGDSAGKKDNNKSVSPKKTHALALRARCEFRIAILRTLKGGVAVRDLEITLADSPLERWFCFIESFDRIKAPSKSTIDRAKNAVSPQTLEQAAKMLLQKAASTPDCFDPLIEKALNCLGLEMPANLLEVWYDGTCHSPNIHFPVDWVQLGDCCRTLLKAVATIRRHGIINRMPKGATKQLLHDLNQLSIALGNARRRKDSKRTRKKILRELKTFAKRMARHARAHRDLLEKHRSTRTDLSEGQAALILNRIDGVLAQLPQAIKQAHERIIGERRVPNDQKILSIYEPTVKVLKRGKSGAEVEYGNQLLIGENRDGLITHWELFEDVRADSRRLLEAIEKTEDTIGAPLQKVVGDKGFSDEKTHDQLKKERPGLIDHICPRSPAKLSEKKKSDPEFSQSQTRRSQTEGRIAILTKNYQKGRSLSKGLDSQRQELRWVMLSHNLRKLARMLIAERDAREKALRKKAA